MVKAMLAVVSRFEIRQILLGVMQNKLCKSTVIFLLQETTYFLQVVTPTWNTALLHFEMDPLSRSESPVVKVHQDE